MFPVVGNAIKRSVLHYYVALQLSAGAVAPLQLTYQDEGPSPIVRQYRTMHDHPWDPREVVFNDGELAIVTVPASSNSRTTERFRLN